MLANRLSSLPPNRAEPSAKLVPAETAARWICEMSPYRSSSGHLRVSRYTARTSWWDFCQASRRSEGAGRREDVICSLLRGHLIAAGGTTITPPPARLRRPRALRVFPVFRVHSVLRVLRVLPVL